MQTFPLVFFHNVLSKNPLRFHAEEETSGLKGRMSQENSGNPQSTRHAAPSPGRTPPTAMTEPVKQLT